MGSMLVRHEAASAALVRHELAEQMRRRLIPQESIDDAELVATELVGNAIRHASQAASGKLDVEWDIDAAGVTIAVSDASTTYPRPRAAHDHEPGGRGLTIIEALSDSWGVQPLGVGKRVWAHLPLRRVGAMT